MKKHVFMCLAVTALLLASCKNEDISISREVTFNVEPYSVISGFAAYQVNANDLETLSSGDKLRVHLLVYDAKGDLVESELKYLSDYRSTMNVAFDLPDGDYTVVATSDVATLSGSTVSFEYWEFSGFDRLSDFRVSETGYIGFDDKILGVLCEKINVRSGQETHNLNLKPAGALYIVKDWNIHNFSDVEHWRIIANKGSNSYTFNANGTYNANIDEGSYFLHNMTVSTHDGDNYYSYHFSMPYGNTTFVWSAYLNDGSALQLADGVSLSVEKEKVYYMNCSCDLLEWEVGELTGNKSVLAPNDAQKLRANKLGYMVDRIVE